MPRTKRRQCNKYHEQKGTLFIIVFITYVMCVCHITSRLSSFSMSTQRKFFSFIFNAYIFIWLMHISYPHDSFVFRTTYWLFHAHIHFVLITTELHAFRAYSVYYVYLSCILCIFVMDVYLLCIYYVSVLMSTKLSCDSNSSRLSYMRFVPILDITCIYYEHYVYLFWMCIYRVFNTMHNIHHKYT